MCVVPEGGGQSLIIEWIRDEGEKNCSRFVGMVATQKPVINFGLLTNCGVSSTLWLNSSVSQLIESQNFGLVAQNS